MFQILNTLIRTSNEAREAVLQYFARVISLNNKRAGMQVCVLYHFWLHRFIKPHYGRYNPRLWQQIAT